METAFEEKMLITYASNAIEAEVDSICNKESIFVLSIMEHIEYTGIHSEDSGWVILPVTLTEKVINTIKDYTQKIALALKVVGLINIQFAISKGKVYLLEANPRASRTVPLVSKVCGLSMAKIATGLMIGKKLKDYNLNLKQIPHFGVKEAVFPFNMFPEVDPLLGPEMRSTGEVFRLTERFELALYKRGKDSETKTSLRRSSINKCSLKGQKGGAPK